MHQSYPSLLVIGTVLGLPSMTASGEEPLGMDGSQSSQEEVLTIDAATCKPEQKGFSFGLGSVHVTVLGLEEDQCGFRVSKEIEGAGSDYRCRVPISEGTVTIEEALQPDGYLRWHVKGSATPLACEFIGSFSLLDFIRGKLEPGLDKSDSHQK